MQPRSERAHEHADDQGAVPDSAVDVEHAVPRRAPSLSHGAVPPSAGIARASARPAAISRAELCRRQSRNPSVAAIVTPTYGALVAARKACRICVERSTGRLRSCAEFDFDPDVVSHWEQWLGHRRPKLLLVGQDFGNIEYFERCRGRDEPRNPTNLNLHRLLAAAGVAVKMPPRFDPDAPVFATNSILCVKEGKMSGAILSSWVDCCAATHLAPIVQYLRPLVVVAMGAQAWRAVCRVFTLADAPPRISEAAGGDWFAEDGTRVFAVGHPGPLGLTNRPWMRQLADWRNIGAALAATSEAAHHPQYGE